MIHIWMYIRTNCNSAIKTNDSYLDEQNIKNDEGCHGPFFIDDSW